MAYVVPSGSGGQPMYVYGLGAYQPSQQQYQYPQYPQAQSPQLVRQSNFQVARNQRQPRMIMQRDDRKPIRSYLWFAIFTCLCCFWPVGIVAIFFSVQTRGEKDRGDLRAARWNSKRALWCSFAALGVGIIAIIVGIVILGLYFTSGLMWNYSVN